MNILRPLATILAALLVVGACSSPPRRAENRLDLDPLEANRPRTTPGSPAQPRPVAPIGGGE